jgi:hypothetical protein
MLIAFTGGCHGYQQKDHSGMPRGGSMSQTARYEWRDQQATLQRQMKEFLENPGGEQMEAVMAEMRAYAAAARAGSIEIPQRWISYN